MVLPLRAIFPCVLGRMAGSHSYSREVEAAVRVLDRSQFRPTFATISDQTVKAVALECVETFQKFDMRSLRGTEIHVVKQVVRQIFEVLNRGNKDHGLSRDIHAEYVSIVATCETGNCLNRQNVPRRPSVFPKQTRRGVICRIFLRAWPRALVDPLLARHKQPQESNKHATFTKCVKHTHQKQAGFDAFCTRGTSWPNLKNPPCWVQRLPPRHRSLFPSLPAWDPSVGAWAPFLWV